MKLHKLKTIQPYFNEVLNDVKKFELRKDDRGFEIDDVLQLFEGTEQVENLQIRDNKNFIYVKVIYKLEGGIYGLEKGYCILGVERYISQYEFKTGIKLKQ